MDEPRDDIKVDEDIGTSEVGNRNKSGLPKYHHILNIIGNMSDSMVTMR